MTVAALTRGDIADYVSALTFVYSLLIVFNIVLSWIQQFRPIPYTLTVRAVTGFVVDTTDPYLAVFRRWCRGSVRSTSARSWRSSSSASAAESDRQPDRG